MKHRSLVAAAILCAGLGVVVGRWAVPPPPGTSGTARTPATIARVSEDASGRIPPVDLSAGGSIETNISSVRLASVTRIAPSATSDASVVLPGEILGQRCSRVRDIIRESLPTAESPVVDVLADEYANLSDDEIIFLLSQQKTIGSLLAPSGGMFSRSAFPDGGREAEVSEAATFLGDTEPPSTAMVHIAQENLRNVDTVGYRSRVPFAVVSPADMTQRVQSELRDLHSGRHLLTGDPLHVAIQTPGPIFFQLEDGRLTRNGMFCRLSDGRIGLRTGDDAIALMDSPVIPADGTVVRIDAVSGEVIAGQAGGTTHCGTIRIVTVSQPSELSTTDGVYFSAPAAAVSAQEVAVQTGTVELSNVDVQSNRRLLEAVGQSRVP